MAVLPDPARSRCLLVGVSRHASDDLADLPAVENNLEALRAALTDPEVWGLAAEHCVVLRPAVAGEVIDRIHSLTQEAEDTFVLYFAGHGLVDSAGDDGLQLAMPQSTRHRSHWSLLYKAVVKALKDNESRAERNIVILDCCYSGTATSEPMGVRRPRPEEPPVDGIFLLTATKRHERATSPAGQLLTDFTDELLSVLSEGLPEGPPLLDLDTLHRELYGRMARRNGTHPDLAATRSSAARLALARNRAYREPPDGPATGRTRPRPRRRVAALAVAAVVAVSAVTVALLDPFGGGGSSASPPSVGGLLRGTGSAFTGNVELSSEGRTDWVQWGYLSQDEDATGEFAGGREAKAECAHLNVYCVTRKADAFVIGDFTALGTEEPTRLYAGRQPVTFSWTGGTSPHQAARNVRSVVYQGGPGAGFRILVPSKSTTRVFRLYVGYRQGAVRFTAALGKDARPAYRDHADTASGPQNKNYYRVYEITFRTPEPALLDVNITLDRNHGGGNVTLLAATLA
ncbi:caspase family protein [Streptomyces sp. NPDC086023]|uniref:caspase, EACC1-associated type n=1 Tax=Streptomyces sp. NPDC086023 TaxID=3365746 RepID=UPI0037D443AB